MAKLLLDLGNSRWKLATRRDIDIGTVSSGGYDELGKLRDAAVARAETVDGLIMASVVDHDVAVPLVHMLEQQLDTQARRVTSLDAVPGVQSGYRKPEQLGIDRLMAMVAARARSTQPLCVIDAGTAVTIDFVDAQGQHLGGFILPGSRLFRECLLAKTAIPRDPQVDEAAILGRDTPTAVALGARYSVAGLVERFVGGSASLFGNQPVQTYVGGGDADTLLALLPQPCSKLDHLVLRGLAVVAAGENG